jgi:2-aminobenzoate-CoA ligase
MRADRLALNKPVSSRRSLQTDDVALLGFVRHDRRAGRCPFPPRPADHRDRPRRRAAPDTAGCVRRLAATGVRNGLGGLAIFPLRFGATATLLENASPANMIDIETYKATISVTRPRHAR